MRSTFGTNAEKGPARHGLEFHLSWGTLTITPRSIQVRSSFAAVYLLTWLQHDLTCCDLGDPGRNLGSCGGAQGADGCADLGEAHFACDPRTAQSIDDDEADVPGLELLVVGERLEDAGLGQLVIELQG